MTDAVSEFVLEGARRILGDWPDAHHLRDLINTTEEAIREGSDQAIDGAKCIVECICKTILEEHGIKFSTTSSPAGLVNLTARAVGFGAEEADEAVRKIASGLVAATEGLSQLRNSSGPMGHGRHALHTSVGHPHRLLAVSTAEAIAVTLYEAHASRQLNLRYTRREFDDDAETNRRIDEAVSVRVEEDTGAVVIDDFLTFRPSQILYAFDREAYISVLKGLPLPEEDEYEGEDTEA